jgi:hypothetical protein
LAFYLILLTGFLHRLLRRSGFQEADKR